MVFCVRMGSQPVSLSQRLVSHQGMFMHFECDVRLSPTKPARHQLACWNRS